MMELNQKFVKLVEEKIAAGEEESKIRKWIRSSLGKGKTRGNEIYAKIKAGEDVIPKPLEFKVEDISGDCFSQKGSVAVASARDIRTLEELVDFHQVDTEVWEAVKVNFNVWDGKSGAKAEFKKRQEVIDLKEILAEFKADFESFRQKSQSVTKRKFTEGKLLEVCAFDLHLGKLGWEQSDGQNYDLSIAEEVFKRSIINIVEKAKAFGEYEKVVFPIGNDFLTCDNSHNTTFASTPQSVDSRFPKIFRKGRELLVWAIELLKQVAPVDVVYVVSNHDTDSMFHMSDAIQCWYRNDSEVSVDTTPSARKYYRFGEVVIAYAHGDKIPLAKFPALAVSEYRDWSACKHREIHTGDKHHEKAFIAEEGSCIIRIVPSLSANDNYHSFHGFVGAKQRGQGFVWDRNDGLEAIIYSKSEN